MRRSAVLSAAVLAGLATVATGARAQGYGVYEHDACVMGRSGTAVAAPCGGGGAVFFNPAGILGSANRWDISFGATLIAPRNAFRDSATGLTTNGAENNLPVPNLYVTRQFSDRFAAGIGVFVPYGLVSEWPNDFAGRFLGYRSELTSIYVQPTVAYRVHPRVRLGAGLTFVHSSVDLKQRVDLSAQEALPGITFAMLGVPAGTDFADAQLTGSGTAFGGHVGVLAQLTDRISVGARYLTKVTVDIEGDASFRPVPTGITLAAGNPFGAPAGTPLDAVVASAFTSTLANQQARTSAPMPAQLVAGVAFKPSPKLTVLFDYQMVVWSAFEFLALDLDSVGQDTLYEDYTNTSGFRVGAEYAATPTVMVRGGLLYHGAAAPDQTVTPLLPEGERMEGTLGVGLQLARRIRLDLAYQYLRQQDRRGRVVEPPLRGPIGTSFNTGLYTGKANLFGASLALGF
jgi:long-chain fatty acid transport protein